MEDLKKSLRSSLAAKRQALSPASASALSAAIQERVLGFRPYLRSADVGLYASTQNEVSTQALFLHAIGDNKRVYFPRINPADHFLDWVRVLNLKELSLGPMGVPEPSGKPITCWPDPSKTIIFVPGVGFDGAGNRIGRGKGHYDSFLARPCRPGTIVGLAFEFQVVPKVPVDPGDQRVDYVITEKRIISTLEGQDEKSPTSVPPASEKEVIGL